MTNIKVTQADRSRAIEIHRMLETFLPQRWIDQMRQGELDKDRILQQVARHRIQATAAKDARIAELERALDKCRCIIKFHVKDAGVCCNMGGKVFSALDAYNEAVEALANKGDA